MGKKESYAEMLRNPLWQKKRLEILERDNYMCQYCGNTTKELHVHHKTYKMGAAPWEYDNDNLITLCHDCHEIETQEKKELYTMFQEVCLLNRKCGFSEQLLSSILSRIYGELEMIYENESVIQGCNSIIEEAFYGTQIINDGKILYDKGVISSDEKMDNIKKYMPQFYKFIAVYGNENDK